MNKVLTNKILKMVKSDQDMRFGVAKGKRDWDSNIDKVNTQTLKQILKKYGWPDNKLVGKKASIGPWLLAQHADHDLNFQKRCLKLMQQKAKDNLIDPMYIAYLTDRVLVSQGKWQLYGTQFYRNKSGDMKERPIKDRKKLSQRRKSLGLEPFSEYKKLMTNKRGS